MVHCPLIAVRVERDESLFLLLKAQQKSCANVFRPHHSRLPLLTTTAEPCLPVSGSILCSVPMVAKARPACLVYARV